MKPEQLSQLPVTDLISPSYVLAATDPISKIIGRMQESQSHEAFVGENSRTGIVTARDVLNVRNITTTKLSSVMRYVPRLNPHSRVGEAARIMYENGIRSLPIYDNSKLRGEISSRLISERLMGTDHSNAIDSIMTPNPICVSSSDDVAKARRIMLRRKIDELPILRERRLSAVISSSDIVFKALPIADRVIKGGWRRARFDVSVLDFAPPNVISNDAGDSLTDVFRSMSNGGTNYSVITNFDEVQGIVTYSDFMKLLALQTGNNATDSIPLYMVGLPDDPFEAGAAKEKFARVVGLFKKEHPDVLEARAVIRAGKTKASKKRYEVQIMLKTERRLLSYQGLGFDLAEVFDDISSWSKRQGSAENSRKKRRTRADPGSIV